MELLAPGGSLEKLKYAIEYGADAVYAAGKQFGLRAKAGNLSNDELLQAVDYCHSRQKKIYIPLNIFAHNRDFDELPDYIHYLSEIGVDAVIVSDAGVLSIVREIAPELTIHLSTQANTTSYKAAEFWHKQGVRRIILARELNSVEIREIKTKVPGLELEIFVHGAMCISYSGRCLISAFLNNRSSNKGLCTHPCRWKLHLYEESRPNQYFPVEEDDRGSYILNSKDLCLFEKLAEINSIGVNSVKIEGRMKSLYYVANTTRVYRQGIDMLLKGEENSEGLSYLRNELDKISHREYTTGFFHGYNDESQCYESSSYIREYQFLGEIIAIEESGAEASINEEYLLSINVRAKFSVGEEIELVFPDYREDFSVLIDAIYDANNNLISDTKPNTIAKIVVNKRLPVNGIARKRVIDDDKQDE